MATAEVTHMEEEAVMHVEYAAAKLMFPQRFQPWCSALPPCSIQDHASDEHQ
jgi:hypothetical protein